MAHNIRFGRKLQVPATSVIKHQLRMMSATDSLSEGLRADHRSPGELGIAIGDLVAEYGISRDRAYMLMDRSGIDRAHLKLA